MVQFRPLANWNLLRSWSNLWNEWLWMVIYVSLFPQNVINFKKEAFLLLLLQCCLTSHKNQWCSAHSQQPSRGKFVVCILEQKIWYRWTQNQMFPLGKTCFYFGPPVYSTTCSHDKSKYKCEGSNKLLWEQIPCHAACSYKIQDVFIDVFFAHKAVLQRKVMHQTWIENCVLWRGICD